MEAAIVTGYRRELFADRGLAEFHNPRWAETNMVSSLACAQKWLQAETCIVSYSDIFYSAQAVKLLMESQAALAVTYDPNWLELWKQRFGDPLVDAETFRLNLDQTLAEIGKKPKSAERQWAALHKALLDEGAAIEFVEPKPGLPDLVFTANAAIVLDGKALLARFRHPERQREEPVFAAAFRILKSHAQNDEVADLPNYLMLEGAGDCIWDACA